MNGCVLFGLAYLQLLLDDDREYWHCQQCQLIQVPASQQLDQAAGRAHYDTHQNDPHDLAYWQFLDRLCRPLGDLLAAGSRGLDFGCGPRPTLALMMAERGHRMVNLDRHYAPDAKALEQRYDFITLTEVIKHLNQLWQTLSQLWKQLEPGGYLAVMTQMTDPVCDFANWYYRRDPTHIAFWSRSTFRWLAENLPAAELLLPDRNLAFLRRARG